MKSLPGTAIVDVGHGRLFLCSVHVFQTSLNARASFAKQNSASAMMLMSRLSGSVTVLERQSCWHFGTDANEAHGQSFADFWCESSFRLT